MEENINDFPDVMVNKQELIEKYFPYFKVGTLNKYILNIADNEQFKHVILRPSTRMTMINVRGFIFICVGVKNEDLNDIM